MLRCGSREHQLHHRVPYFGCENAISTFINTTGQVGARASCASQTTTPPPQRWAPRRPAGPPPAACSRAQLRLLPPRPRSSAPRREQRRPPRDGSRMRQSLGESPGTFAVTAPQLNIISKSWVLTCMKEVCVSSLCFHPVPGNPARSSRDASGRLQASGLIGQTPNPIGCHSAHWLAMCRARQHGLRADRRARTGQHGQPVRPAPGGPPRARCTCRTAAPRRPRPRSPLAPRHARAPAAAACAPARCPHQARRRRQRAAPPRPAHARKPHGALAAVDHSASTQKKHVNQ